LTSQDNNTSFQINKPSGVAAGDFMIAAVATFPARNASKRTVTPPVGWTLVDDFIAESGATQPCQLTILTRTAGSSEPGSWIGSYSANVYVEAQLCVAYRGLVGISDKDTATAGSATSVTVGPVTSSQVTNWRIVIGAYSSSSINFEIDSNETTERVIAGLKRSDDTTAVQCGVWDSGGTVATGDYSKNVTRGAVWGSASAWLGVLDANDATVSGSMSGSLELLSVDMDGTVSHDGPLAATLPQLSVSLAGIATPPSGSLAVTVTPSMSVAGAVVPTGSLGALVVPVVDVVGETRRFGIRVVVVEAEDRVVTPTKGATD
jgi:hypothetical protein